MRPLGQPDEDCDYCEGRGVALKMCPHCEALGDRPAPYTGDWTPCTMCQGRGTQQHLCDCCEEVVG